VSDAVDAVVDLVRAHRARSDTPTVVGIAGAVAVGKSLFAEQTRSALTALPGAGCVEIVATDGFLLSNAVLAERGLLMRKGFPESYDTASLRDFASAVRAGAGPLHVPVYSHEVYDILPGAVRELGPVDVVIIEGVNALSALPDLLDVAVYLDADAGDIEAWYVTRFHELRSAARDDPNSFYRGLVAMTDDDADAIARQVWREVNAVNLREHIEPSRRHAHCIVAKAADHTVRSVILRSPEGDQRAF